MTGTWDRRCTRTKRGNGQVPIDDWLVFGTWMDLFPIYWIYSQRDYLLSMGWNMGYMYIYIWLGIYWEFHHPNWRTHNFFRGVGPPPTRWFSQLWTSIYCVIRSGISQPATFDETGGEVLTWVVKTRWYPGDLTRIAGEWMQMDVPHESQYIYNIYIRYHTIVNQRSWSILIHLNAFTQNMTQMKVDGTCSRSTVWVMFLLGCSGGLMAEMHRLISWCWNCKLCGGSAIIHGLHRDTAALTGGI